MSTKSSHRHYALGRRFVIRELTMERRRSLKYVRMLLMATPFLVPLFIGLVEEVCGRVIAWNYAMVSLFVVSLIAFIVRMGSGRGVFLQM